MGWVGTRQLTRDCPGGYPPQACCGICPFETPNQAVLPGGGPFGKLEGAPVPCLSTLKLRPRVAAWLVKSPETPAPASRAASRGLPGRIENMRARGGQSCCRGVQRAGSAALRPFHSDCRRPELLPWDGVNQMHVHPGQENILYAMTTSQPAVGIVSKFSTSPAPSEASHR